MMNGKEKKTISYAANETTCKKVAFCSEGRRVLWSVVSIYIHDWLAGFAMKAVKDLGAPNSLFIVDRAELHSFASQLVMIEAKLD